MWIFAVEAAEIPVCGKERLLCEILRVEVIFRDGKADGDDETLILCHISLKLLCSDTASPSFCRFTHNNDPANKNTSRFSTYVKIFIIL